ncbi:hypothetical protein FKG94_17535 [Exilibacterium tricleocarpae]|uniref:Gamma-glutamyltransferase n=1 Tax=Exilibacterium tricleocarpae TaxID=2591008 RepID=A0A545T8G6_9GAMM|nr:gamma-glutamyltransferase [Exilibacterium tricleocarpae]TQV73501.1 hypothetical protein FKG94_17535 [Exilibacterium tricleocarpae]
MKQLFKTFSKAMIAGTMGGLAACQSGIIGTGPTLQRSVLYSDQALPESTATTAMVTGTTGAAAQQAGVDILRAGGTAADAAVGTAMKQICLAAGAWVSYAGIMNVVYYEAATGKVYNMNASYNTVAGETDPASIPPVEFSRRHSKAAIAPNGRSVLVPGFMKGADELVKRFGRLSLAEVVAPSVQCAEQGFTWHEVPDQIFAFRKDLLARDAETKAVFTSPNGDNYQVGETFRQPALAQTLKAFSQKGADYIYKGPWAKKLVDKVQAMGGKLSLADMAGYEVIWSEPLSTQYHGYDVYVHGLPAVGGVATVEAMELSELAKLPSMGHYSESPEALLWMSNITRVGISMTYAAELVGKALSMDLSPQSRLKPEVNEKIWQLIKAGHFPGVVSPKKIVPAHSDGVVVIDQWGNIATMVHTINTEMWGTTGLFVDGVSIPDSASIQVPQVAAVTPGERLPDPTNPGLVLKDGKPFLGFASIGAGLHQRTLSCLISVLDFGMTPQQAINAPAWGFLKFDAKDPTKQTQQFGIGDLEPQMIKSLNAMGMEIDENDTTRGYWIGIQIDPESGQLKGGSPRALGESLGGRAVGY